MITCSVCCERYNKTNHKNVCCPFCDFETCRACSQTYLLSTSEDPHCMSCKKGYNREFVDSFCTKRFRNNEYKKHREQVLFERELIRMPETQPHVQRIMRRRELITLRDEISRIYIKARRKYYHSIETNGRYVDTYLTMCIFAEKAHNLLREELEKLRHTPIDASEVATKFVRGCPSEDCRGFLNELWKCGICSQSFCENCNEECGHEHSCNPDTVKTMKLINRDTKPCPKCATMIHKIDGCAQMWCTTCQTAFDWTTGKVETGRIHNPHYFEFRKRSREHGDIPCGGRPTYRELIDESAPHSILSLSQAVGIAEHSITYRYDFVYTDNLNLRISYLMNNISENDFKRELQKRDKYNDKVRDIQQIYQMFVDTGGDLLRQWMIDKTKTREIMDTAFELAKYTNGVINRIHNRYMCQVPRHIFLSRV